MNQQLHAHALALSGAIVVVASMLLLDIGANIGVYDGVAAMMQQWHLFFSPSFGGIIAGMVEAAIITYVFFHAGARVYNHQLDRREKK